MYWLRDVQEKLSTCVFLYSLHSNSALDVSIKGQMIRDVLNLAGFVLPKKEDIPSSSSGSSSTSRSEPLL